MSAIRSFIRPALVALALAGTLGGCAVYVPPGSGPGYHRGYYAPAPYYYGGYGGYYGRPYFRGG